MEKKELALQLQHMMFLIGRKKEIYGETQKHGMRGKDAIILKTIAYMQDGKPVKMKEIASFFHISAPACSQLINRLEKMGYITREKGIEDKRSVGICISEKAKKEMEENEHFLTEQLLNLVDYLGEEEATLLLQLMKKTYQYTKNITIK